MTKDKRKPRTRLELKRATLRTLDDGRLGDAAGGGKPAADPVPISPDPTLSTKTQVVTSRRAQQDSVNHNQAVRR